MNIKIKCRSCQCIYLGGQDGLCNRCLSGKRRKLKSKPIHCLCGKRAVVVILAHAMLPEEGLIELETPLCQRCLELERTLEGEPRAVNKPVPTDLSQVVVLKSLPRVNPPLKGRKI